jgi:hypothetical protein
VLSPYIGDNNISINKYFLIKSGGLMFRKISILFLFVLILSSPLKLYSQTSNQFPFGFYIYGYNGLLGGVNSTDYVDRQVLEFWYNQLGANCFVMQCDEDSSTASDGIKLAQLHHKYITNSQYSLKYCSPIIINAYSFPKSRPYAPYMNDNMWPSIFSMCASTYKKFNSISTNNSDGFVLTSQSALSVTASSGGGITISNPLSNLYFMQSQVIDNVKINGTSNNTEFIRPSYCNENLKTSPNQAEFVLRIKISSISKEYINASAKIKDNNADNTIYSNWINVYIRNSNSGCGQSINDTPLAATVPFKNGIYYFPFAIKYGDATCNCSGFHFGFKFELAAGLNPGKSFKVEEVAVYDSLGVNVIENDFFNKSGNSAYPNWSLGVNFTNLFNIGYQNFESPIIHLADEGYIGSVLPMNKVITEILTRKPNARFYLSTPLGIGVNPTKYYIDSIAGKFANTTFYLGADIYPFKLLDGSSFEIYKQRLCIDFTDTLKRVRNQIRSNVNSNVKLIGVPQLHGLESEQLRNPTGNEVLATAYITLLADCKGTMFYEAFPSMNETNLYMPMEAATSKYDYLVDPNNFDLNAYSPNTGITKLSALKKFSTFLNASFPFANSLTNGQFLLGNRVNEFAIIGDESNSESVQIDNADPIQLSNIQIVSPTNHDSVAVGSYLMGVGSIKKQDTTVYLLTNLSHTSKDTYVRLILNSSNSSELKITGPNLLNVISGGKIESGAYVDVKIPKDSAFFIQVEKSFGTNTNIGLLFDYWESGQSRIHLITPHLQPSNGFGDEIFGYAELINDHKLEANKIKFAVPGDFNRDGHQDLALIYDSTGTGSGFQIHLITTSQNGQSSIIMNWSDHSANSTSPIPLGAIKFALGGDFNKDGYDEIALLYNCGYNNGPTGMRVHLIKSHDISSPEQDVFSWSDHVTKDVLSLGCIKFAVAGDFNKDGYKDIALVFDYGNGIRIHLLKAHPDNDMSNDEVYGWSDHVTNNQLYADAIKFAVPGDFNNDGYDDIALVYGYSSNETRVHLIKAHTETDATIDEIYGWSEHLNGSNYLDINKIKFAIPGDFNLDNHMDIAYLYDETGTGSGLKIHLDKSTSTGNSEYLANWSDHTTNNILSLNRIKLAIPWDISNGTAINKNLQCQINKIEDFTYNLDQNYPNPFNPTTQISYSIKTKCVAELKVYDILGKEIATLVNMEKEPGKYSVQFNASQLSSGIYFYRLKAGDFVVTKKMMVLK